ncbi:hypothetical protein Taro_018486, partial [Colocasia esculenta]|nr:hypothetical protein [Colocasia esculenta]
MFPMKIWCVEHDRAPVLGGASVGGFCSRHQLLVLRLSLLRVRLHLLNLEDQVRVSLHLLITYAFYSCYNCWCSLCVFSSSSSSSSSRYVQCQRMLLVSRRGEAVFMRALYGSDKIEPAQASQFITRTIQAHFPGPIHRFNDFPMEVQELLYQMFMSYSQQMTEKYAGEDKQPQLDPEVWVAASGALKKGHVYGFGNSMDTSRVLSGASSSASHTSAFNTGVGAPGTSPIDMMGFITNTISGLESRIAQTMETRLVQMQTQETDALQAQLS